MVLARFPTGRPAGADVFGKGYVSVSADSRTTTTSAIFQPKVSLTTGPLGGTYRVGWCAVVDNDKKAGEFRLRNLTDGVTIGAAQIFTAFASGERRAVVGFAEVPFAGVAKTFEIQFRDQSGGNTQGIAAAKIEIWRAS